MKLIDFNNSDYEPSPETEDTTALTMNSLNIIKDSIRMQFNDPSGYGKIDAVENFIIRYNSTLREISDDFDEEEQAIVRDIHRDFISFMEAVFKDKLKIGIPDLDDMSQDAQDMMIHYLYRFFITNIRQNMLNFIKSYIKKNKSALAQILPNTNTASSKRFSNIMNDAEIVKICANIDDVVKLAMTDKEVTVSEFLEMCKAKEDDLEREFVDSQYDKAGITGNFVNRYRKMLPEWCIVELTSTLIAQLVVEYKNPEESNIV